jgi:hypothetical protein
LRLREFSQHKIKIVFMGIQLPALSQNNQVGCLDF